MAFVFYDVETTGLQKRYDQILTFAAILTDEQLVELDRFECECRLMPHIVPHPAALSRNGLSLTQISSPSLASHYDMNCEIVRCLEGWGQALYVGYNSITFDEEFLRQSLYLSLHNPYLTSRSGCGRADALTLVRTIAFLSPGALTIPLNADGRPSLRLEDVARANGIAHMTAHRAIDDVEATLGLCRMARDRDGDTWSRFLKMSTKSAVSDLLDTEDAVLHISFRGNDAVPKLITLIGSEMNKRWCLPVTFDAGLFAELDDAAAWQFLNDRDFGFVVIETNKCPVLSPLYDAPEDLLLVSDAEELGSGLRADKALAERIGRLVQSNQPDWSAFRELEDRLYEQLPFPQDDPGKRRFHAADWPERTDLARSFSDVRARAAALRIIHSARPDLLTEEEAARVVSGIRRRLNEEPGRRAWRTLSAAVDGLSEVPAEARFPLESEFVAWRDRFAAAR